MIRGTTPTFILTLNDSSIDLTQARNVYVSFNQPRINIVKTGEDIVVTKNEVDVYLSQEDTLKFYAGTVDIQINWIYDDGSRASTDIVSVNIDPNLIGRVLE